MQRPLVWALAGEVVTVERHRALARSGVKPVMRVDEGGLPGAVGADQPDEHAVMAVEVDRVVGMQAAIADRQPASFEQRHIDQSLVS